MNLSETIHIARNQSVEALEARQAFISTYWAYRSYKASRLPSFYLYGDIMNFDRSLTLLQNYEDGSLNYVSTNNIQNSRVCPHHHPQPHPLAQLLYTVKYNTQLI